MEDTSLALANEICELTILLPCLNEARTLATCIGWACDFLAKNGVEGEVLIADNGSTDGSGAIAQREGARVICVQKRGYGAALRAGCQQARGEYVIMGDADGSYDLLHLEPFMQLLRDGCDLVVGNRYLGGIERGAMPLLHRYLGNPLLSLAGRSLFQSKVRDFHCGLRGYRRDAILNLNLQADGMEYASEMIIRSELAGLKVVEVPTTLRKDGRGGKSHLRSLPDGWRHLKLMARYAPAGRRKGGKSETEGKLTQLRRAQER